MTINRALLVGRLTADPELSTTQGGTSRAALRLAVNSREKQGEEWVDRADFFDITVWGNTAEACAQYLAKGSQIAIDGHLRQDRWENKEGEKRSKVIVVVGRNGSIQFLDTRSGEGDSDFSAPRSGDEAPTDDLPF